jgi:16S rRNA C967 or C1407 C5-methylase (RsmB/RsmF family)/NOL1/NOP2/fmu family ribosome biogenesis protein
MTELPQAFVFQMAAQLKGETAAFLHTYEEPYQRGIRMNPYKKASNLPEGCLEKVPWEENGFYLSTESTAGSDVLHDAGAWYIQEPSAMIPAAVLNAQPGEHILDLCAAPGGKATQSGLRMRGQGMIICNEPVWERAKVLSQNIERMGIPNALVVSAYPEQLAARWPEAFDAIQVDAPCSGEGMFRRHPETRDEWTADSPVRCAKRQADILHQASIMLRPGGRLVYSTCTMNRTENEDTVDTFLSVHPEFELVPFSLPGIDAPDGMKTCYPHQIKGEGHFVALLHKKGPSERIWHAAVSLKQPSKEAMKLLHDFCPEQAANIAWKNEIRQRNQKDEPEKLCFLPDIPDCTGIRIARCGLTLGSVQKGIFAPDHAWAMSIFPPDCPQIALTKEQAQAYQRGETISADGKGWALACYDGIALGWGKLSEGIMKNHYPKGLRRPAR